MAPNGTVVNNNNRNSSSSSCANLSNPYHQCSQACAQKTTKGGGGGGGGGGRTKTHTNYNQNTTTTTTTSSVAVAGGGRREAKNSNQVVRPTKSKTGCPKASNPYHNCDTNCNKTTHSVTAPDSNLKRAAKPKPPPAVLDQRAVPLPSSKSKPAPAPPSPPHHNNNNLEDPKTDNHHIIIAAEAEAEAEAEQQHLMITTTNPIGTEDNDKVASSPDELLAAAAGGPSRDFSFSAGSNEDEEEETESVISECRVPVGKYNVKESFGSILQSILDKYGDIGESCHLESVAMRTYYIECVCYVVQELQSHSVTNSNSNSKTNELLAILKDVECAQIRVPWLRIALDHNIQIQSLREQLESELEALALKEKEVDDIKNNRIPHIRDRLRFTEPNFTSTLPN